MRIISIKKLKKFWKKYPDSNQSLRSWYEEVKKSNWNKTSDVKSLYKTASILSSNRIVFNIKGNKYRMVVAVRYKFKIVYIRFVGTHKEYDKIDVNKI
jgi:mRNA interferase HigB